MNLVHCSKQCRRFLEVDHLGQAVLALGRGQAERQVPWAWTPEVTGSGPRLQEGGSSLTSPLPGADVGHRGRLAWLQIRGWEGRGWGCARWSLGGEETCQLQSGCSLQASNPSPHPEHSPAAMRSGAPFRHSAQCARLPPSVPPAPFFPSLLPTPKKQ